jgi:ribonuclease P protein component
MSGNRLARLLKRADFLRVAATRKKWAAPGLILQAAPTKPQTPDDVQAGADAPSKPTVYVGFTTSKKVGNAVERNRARRRLRAAVAEVFPLEASDKVDYVVIGRRETLSRPYSLLLQDLRTALKRVAKSSEKPV